MERNRFVISLGSPLTTQNYLAPDNCIASAGAILEEVVRQQVEALVKGIWTPGYQNVGIAGNTMGWFREASNVVIPDEIVNTINDLETKIAAGELVIPATYDGIDAWLQQNQFAQP
jgi:basic membrane protein A